MKKIAVILAGCGHQDGSEIREAIITLLELDRQGAQVQLFAPNENHFCVINHLNNEVVHEPRNILIESARIARGEIKDLSEAKSQDFDGMIIPGGFGVAKNLSTIAQDQEAAKVNPLINKLINAFISEHKPIGAICISPALVAAAIQGKIKAKLTLGDESILLKAFSMDQEICSTDDCIVDLTHKIVCTPAYMRNGRLNEIAEGISKLVSKVMELC